MRYSSAAVLAIATMVNPGAPAQSAVETFDRLPEQTIAPGHPLSLEHFDIDMPLSDSATIRPVETDDAIASGMGLGTPTAKHGASLVLELKQARQRMDVTFVVPPSQRNYQNIVFLYGVGEKPYSFSLWESPAGHRVRVSLAQPDGTPFTRAFFRLQGGTYVDNVELW
jgi:hypothetical protein